MYYLIWFFFIFYKKKSIKIVKIRIKIADSIKDNAKSVDLK